MERYDRQERIKGWQQDKLSDAKVAVIGSGRLSDFIAVDLLSLGVGNITRIGCSDSFDFWKINPEVYFEQRDETFASRAHAQSVLEEFDFIIDAYEKDSAGNAISSKVDGKGFISARSFPGGFSFSSSKSAFLPEHPSYQFTGQDYVNSIIASGIVADELRKRLMPLEGDSPLEELVYPSPYNRIGLNKRILQIGAGAIGTFSALALTSLGADLTIVDFDVIEESNLNRQFLFYGANGKSKAETLKERLKDHSAGSIGVLNAKIGENFDPRGFDYVLSCVDNNVARYIMNRASSKYGIPLVNGGSSVNAGQASCYVPKKTRCLDCQTGFKLSEVVGQDVKKRTSGACFQPSLVIPNQIVAGMMVENLFALQSGVYRKSNYVSGEGLVHQNLESTCYGSCALSGRK